MKSGFDPEAQSGSISHGDNLRAVYNPYNDSTSQSDDESAFGLISALSMPTMIGDDAGNFTDTKTYQREVLTINEKL